MKDHTVFSHATQTYSSCVCRWVSIWSMILGSQYSTVSTIMCYTDTTMNTIKVSTITRPIHRHLLFWHRTQLGQMSQNGPCLFLFLWKFVCLWLACQCFTHFQWLFQIKSGEQSVLGAFDVEALASFAHVPTAWRDTDTQTVPKLHKKQVPQTTFITYRVPSV